MKYSTKDNPNEQSFMAKYTKRLNLKCWHYFSWLEITYDMPGFSNLLEVNTCRKELSFFSYIVFFFKNLTDVIVHTILSAIIYI